jgi:hypothetical protein
MSLPASVAETGRLELPSVYPFQWGACCAMMFRAVLEERDDDGGRGDFDLSAPDSSA